MNLSNERTRNANNKMLDVEGIVAGCPMFHVLHGHTVESG